MILNLLLKILMKKEDKEMAYLYAILIMKGKRTFAQVPDKIKDKVKETLIDLDLEELLA